MKAGSAVHQDDEVNNFYNCISQGHNRTSAIQEIENIHPQSLLITAGDIIDFLKFSKTVIIMFPHCIFSTEL